MPVALRRPPGRSRSRWFSNYVNLVIDKDVLDISRVRQREMLPRLLGQLAASAGHFRTEAGEEVDLVLERDDGQVIAVEIKAGSRISSEDFRGLRQLKERLRSRLEEAVVLHTANTRINMMTGSRSYR